MTQPAESPNTAPGQPKPVLLEPKLPKLPTKDGETPRTGREANVSPLALAFIEWLKKLLL